MQARPPHLMRTSGIIVSCLVLLACSLWLRVSRVRAEDELTITAAFDSSVQLTPDTPFELNLSRSLKTGEGRIAIMIGRADLTSVFIADGTRLVYSPTV